MAHPPDEHAAVAWARLHARPHAPQWASVVLVLVSQPFEATPSQLPKPALQVATAHAPAAQAAVALGSEHARPHAPQCAAVERVLVSQPFEGLPSQSPKPVAQVNPHAPDAHEGVALAGDGHAFPQRPQWASDEVRLAHSPEQLVSPAAQVERHVPAEQTSPATHARPHEPQLARSVSTLTSHPLVALASQFAKPALHAKPHAPAAHVADAFAGAVQALPQRPQ